jgi:PKD domain/CHAP domain/Fungal fucose-specific lectin
VTRIKILAAAALAVASGLLAAPAASAATAPGAQARGIPATAASGEALTAAYASARHLPRADVGGIRAGSLHIAQVSGVSWATATFAPSAAAGAQVQAGFQDGAATGVFTTSGDQPWRLTQLSGACGQMPAAVRAAWRLPEPASCHAAAASARAAASRARAAAGPARTVPQSIADIALSQVGVADTPAVTNFSVDCDPYSTLVAGFSANADGCGFDQGFGVENENEAWCSDFAKWVWQQAGVTAGMNTLNAGSDSFYDWGLDQGESMPVDAGTPAAGDAVVFFPPGPITPATYADHVGIVTAVNPDGTVNMVNGDFLGASNISVQYDTEISLTSWASQVWNQGEQWLLVTPPGAPQQPVPSAAISGPHAAVAGSTVRFTAQAAEQGGSITQYYWTFGDGRTTNTTGTDVTQVFPAAGVYTVTMTATSSFGTIRTENWNIDVSAASSGVAAVPSDAVWFATTPVEAYLFVPSGAGLAAETWDGASWLDQGIPGQPAPGGPLTALSYADPAAGDAMTPHVYFRSTTGALSETYLSGTGWTTEPLAGSPMPGSAIAATATAGAGATAATPAVFYFNAAGYLAESAEQGTTWVTSAVGGPATGDPGALALADTARGTDLFYTGSHGGLTVAWSDSRGWHSSPIGASVAAGSPLAAVTTPSGRARVFFIDRRGRLAEATMGGSVRELPGAPAAPTGLAAVNYLLTSSNASSGAPGAAGTDWALGEEVFYRTAAGQPAVTSWAGQQWQVTALPGTADTATGILGASAYPAPGQPQWLLFGTASGVQLDASSAPGAAWTSSTLPGTPATFSDRVVLYAATSADDTSALAAAASAGLPTGQVTTSFATAWADTLIGNYLVIAVGQAAVDALYFNPCGWANPSGDIPGSTPFYIAGSPLDQLPGPGAYQDAAAATASQTPQLAADLAYYATHGALPAGVTSLPTAADPEYTCSGSPS